MHQRKPSSIEESDAPIPPSSRLANAFSQQRLRAWQPILTPRWVTCVFFCFAVLLLTVGILLLAAAQSVVECKVEYGDPAFTACEACEPAANQLYFDESSCTGPIENFANPPFYLYYELNRFYQNHRRYVSSRSAPQLKGEVITDAADLVACDPIVTGGDGKILSPCGLIAWSVFNDSYTLRDQDDVEIPLDESAETIAWITDVENSFKNPSNRDPNVDEWLPENIFPGKVENGHFIVWMSVAALPDFRKLYAKIDQPLTLPISVDILNRYPVNDFGGQKHVVLTSMTWVGGKNNFLGIAYVVLGSLCLFFGLFFSIKNYASPRIIGDVRYLRWVGKAG